MSEILATQAYKSYGCLFMSHQNDSMRSISSSLISPLYVVKKNHTRESYPVIASPTHGEPMVQISTLCVILLISYNCFSKCL